jgi:hypothetical protein
MKKGFPPVCFKTNSQSLENLLLFELFPSSKRGIARASAMIFSMST